MHMKRSSKDILFVGVQFILLTAYLFRLPEIDFRVPEWAQWTGIILSIAGIIISLASVGALNKNLSTFPTPKQNAELIQTGIYKYVRHPIYTGILLFTGGFSIYSENSLRLGISFLLLILFWFKAIYEEKLLQEKFHNYAIYKKMAGRLLPKIKL